MMSRLTSTQSYFNVTKVPTIVIFKDGKEVKKVEGADEKGFEEAASILA